MSIDSFYEDIIAKVTKHGKIVDVSKTLLTLTTNDKRVLYVYNIIDIHKAFPSALEVTKCQKVSTYYRNLGNRLFLKSEDYEAWQYYNLSLLYAPLATDYYCLALANRSAVFFSLKKYKECLQDIKELYTLKYPENLKDKLVKRQTMCEEALQKENKSQRENNEEINKIVTFQGEKDSQYVCASSKLEVVFNKEMGRHVIAKEDIRVGEILAQEDPYLVLLMKSQYLFSCNYCLSRKMNLLPCNYCSYTLYCSTECKENAWKEYHEIECPLMATLIHMEFTKLELLALRTVIKARREHSDWKSLFCTIQKAEATENTEFWGHVKINDKWVYDSKYYNSIHTLASNVEKRSVSDIFQKSVTAAVFLKLLSDKTNFLKTENEDEIDEARKCVAGTLLLHIMTSPTNMHGISSNIQNASGLYVDEFSIGSAPYAFHSLLNHSCSPNVVRFSKLGSGEMTLFALRPIKKGMQLFDNYGPHHALQDRMSRQQSLKFQYKFTCLCEACVNNWPTYLSLSTPRNLPANIKQTKEKLLDSKAIDKLQLGDKAIALKLFKPLCELATALEPYIPCRELADCQESLKQCLVIFQGLVPYGFSKLVDWNAIPPKC